MSFSRKNDEKGKGVITGCNMDQEWLLKWWWKHYRAHNELPVTFMDFGMSKSAQKWCEKQGSLISCELPDDFLQKDPPFPLPSCWGKCRAAHVRNLRSLWFAKAFSLLKTPYEMTLWLDLDCECRGSVDPIFDFCKQGDGFAAVIDSEDTISLWKAFGFLKDSAVGYQAGVMAFKKNSPVTTHLAKRCDSHRNSEYSEQTALNHVITLENLKPTPLPKYYNWFKPNIPCAEAVIVHHAGDPHKRKLLAEYQRI